MNAGAFDYLSKPFRMEEIKIVVQRTLDARRLARRISSTVRSSTRRYGFEALIGQSRQMVEIYKLVARVAALDATVLIEGETGTGKELVARAIHDASAARGRPFVVVDCAALPETLLESRAVRARARRVHRRGRGAAGPASRPRPAAPASSTRSAS